MSGQYLEGVVAASSRAREVTTDTALTSRILELEARLAALRSGVSFDCVRPSRDESACHCCQRRFLKLTQFTAADSQYLDGL